MNTVQATNVTCPHRGRIKRVPVAPEGRPTCGNRKQPLRWMADAGDDDFTSPNRHARRHAAADGHPIAASLEPGEDWRWCFVHEAFV